MRSIVSDPAWGSVLIDVSTARGIHPARLVNLSVRAHVDGTTQPLIAGAAVRGAGTLPTLVRAIGPGLAPFGITDVLRSPLLEVFADRVLMAETNTLATLADAVAGYVGAFPAIPSINGLALGDAAIVGSPAEGTWTAICSGELNRSGVAMLELYDSDAAASASSAQFVNFSARARVDSADNLMIVGFVVRGEGNVRLLLRGVGPSLQQFGVADVLSDPRIELHANGRVLATSDSWLDGSRAELTAAAASVGAFPLSSDADAALIVTVPAGLYTLHVRGAASQAGTALAEVYTLGEPSAFDAAQATNTFGLQLYQRLVSAAGGGNVVISPYSIANAFALAYPGAAGDTRTEMARVLQFPAGDRQLVGGFSSLQGALETMAVNSVTAAEAKSRFGARFDAIQWAVANRIYGQSGFPFRDSYLTLLREGFGAPLESVDFVANPDLVRGTINNWVSRITRENIQDLIPQRGVDMLTRFVLVNALYLKAPWDQPFEKTLTAPGTFTSQNGTAREVPMMHQAGGMRYANEDGLTVVALDYLGRELQFVVLLPQPGETVDALAARLTPADFMRWAQLDRSSERQVALWLPKFEVRASSTDLADALFGMGMRSAFDDSANFDAMWVRPEDAATTDGHLALQRVFHQTFIAIDEEGTEAAAATAIVGGITSVPPARVEVRVDRPFLFAIQHRATGACLFLGRISDPTP